MRTLVNTVCGAPEVLQLNEVEKSISKVDEVLIKVHATVVNRPDCGFRNPEYLIVRILFGLFKPRRTILGSKLAGVIEAIGKNVRSFKVGDQVFGLSTILPGAYAEYICVQEKKAITTKPSNVTDAEDASVCDGAFLAYANIKKIDLKKRLEILINGATEIYNYLNENFTQNGKQYDAVFDAGGKSSFSNVKKY